MNSIGKSVWYYEFPIGRLGIVQENGFLVSILFADTNKAHLDDLKEEKTPIIEETALQLDTYFSLRRKKFNLPIHLRGTDFQRACWNAIKAIPWGETKTYKDIAESLGRPKAVRAVGFANSRNPLPIVVPCHRVIGSDGSLTGYGGGLPVKRYLLDLEKGKIPSLL